MFTHEAAGALLTLMLLLLLLFFYVSFYVLFVARLCFGFFALTP